MQPDRIYRNATIHTMVPGARPATALACHAGRIVAVGEERKILSLVGPGTTTIDLDGATVLPGFIETHLHPHMWALQADQVDANVDTCPTIGAVVAALRTRVASTPPGTPITAWGFDDTLVAERRGLTTADLDAAAPAHPVRVRHLSGHCLYVNSLVLGEAGIDAATPDPVGGKIGRHPDGALSGELYEIPAMRLVQKGAERATPEEYRLALGRALDKMASVGVTGFHDMHVGMDDFHSYRAVHQTGSLGLRARLYLGSGVHEQVGLADVADDRAIEDEHLRIGGIKLIADGSIQLHTAALTEAYHDLDGCNCGGMAIPGPDLGRMVGEAHRAGREVAIHTNGDRAIDLALDAIETAQRARPGSPLRHRLEHVQTIRKDQIARMARLDTAASVFVNHVYYWGDRHRDLFLGPERGARISPLAAITGAGLRYGLHCDCPVTPVDPLSTIATAVNRITRDGAVLGPAERVDVRTAIAGYTSAAARIAGEDADQGILAPGRFADFVALDADPFACPPDAIATIRVRATVVGGKTVYSQ